MLETIREEMAYEEHYKKSLKLKKVIDKINRLENKKITLISKIEIKYRICQNDRVIFLSKIARSFIIEKNY